MYSIVLITTGQPSTNPRAVKEAAALAGADYKVTFIYNFWAAWALPYDKKVIDEYPGVRWRIAGSDPFTSKAGYYFSRIRHKCFRILNKIFPGNISMSRQATSRGFSSLKKVSINIKADLYIAHNLGALPIAALAAKKHRAKYAFDAEDYHRGQNIDGSLEQKRTILLEDKYLPDASYITAASPLIAERYRQHYNRTVTVINNVFSKKYLVEAIRETTKPIKLFWFSQTIGKGRGLEDIILTLKDMPVGTFSLTLLGKYNDNLKNYLLTLGRTEKENVDINFMEPVAPDEIFSIAAQHDIGLALEQPGELNRELCLTNKIFTYLLAGNAIIFSGTRAQKRFYEESPEIGALYECGNITALKNILMDHQENITRLRSMRVTARNEAEIKYNWETEKGSFIKIIEKAFSA